MDFKEIREQVREKLGEVGDGSALSDFWQKYLGKQGVITGLMKEMKSVAPEEKPKFGKAVNEVREWAQNLYNEKQAEIKKRELEKRYEREAVDVTMPALKRAPGNLHPLTLISQQMISVFSGMGFEVLDYPEIEDDDHNFTRLNVLPDHPSRDMQDTFWLTDDLLLRTHTSPGQIRTMDAQKPPIKVLVPGKVFRSDSDATHSPMFMQMEGLVVDKGITLCDLQGMLDEFVQKMFGSGARTRLRPSYFPFTEPSVEVDVSCFECGGSGVRSAIPSEGEAKRDGSPASESETSHSACGCSLCKGTGWIEVLGGGVVNKKVLENCGIDSGEYSGLAFGIGVERITMLKYGIPNMGMFFANDLDFLRQFKA